MLQAQSLLAPIECADGAMIKGNEPHHALASGPSHARRCQSERATMHEIEASATDSMVVESLSTSSVHEAQQHPLPGSIPPLTIVACSGDPANRPAFALTACRDARCDARVAIRSCRWSARCATWSTTVSGPHRGGSRWRVRSRAPAASFRFQAAMRWLVPCCCSVPWASVRSQVSGSMPEGCEGHDARVERSPRQP